MANQQECPCPDFQEKREACHSMEKNEDSIHSSLESSPQGQPCGDSETTPAEGASAETSATFGLQSKLGSVSLKFHARAETADTSSLSSLDSVQVDLETKCCRLDKEGEEERTSCLRGSIASLNITSSVQSKTPGRRRSGPSKNSQSVKCQVCRGSIAEGYQMPCKYCTSVTCLKHRCPEDHMCTKDYKTDGREQLARDNPKIVSKKIEKL